MITKLWESKRMELSGIFLIWLKLIWDGIKYHRSRTERLKEPIHSLNCKFSSLYIDFISLLIIVLPHLTYFERFEIDDMKFYIFFLFNSNRNLAENVIQEIHNKMFTGLINLRTLYETFRILNYNLLLRWPLQFNWLTFDFPGHCFKTRSLVSHQDPLITFVHWLLCKK